MPTYVAFLRAINLGRNRKVPMADLRACLEQAGFTDVETYIQTGNVRIGSAARSREKVEAEVEGLLAERFGFEVPTIALSPVELTEVHAEAEGLDFPVVAGARRYVTFLKSEPPDEVAAEIDAWEVGGERAAVRGRAVHWMVPGPSQAARLSNGRIEKSLGVGTTRDLKVVRALAERWGV